MKIDVKTTERLENLARIELTPEERVKLAVQLDRVIAYTGQLRSVRAGARPPAEPDIPRKRGPLRPDITAACLTRDAVLEPAPATDENAVFFCVPRVIER